MKIQKKTFMLVFSCIAVCIIASTVCNYLFLEKYYLYKMKKDFIFASQNIEKELKESVDDVDAYIEQAAEKSDSRILLLSDDWEVLAISYYQREDKSNIPFNRLLKMDKQRGNDNYICSVFDMKKETFSKMIFLSEMEDGNYLVLMKNTNGVKEGAAVANEFNFIIGIVILCAGIFAASAFSRKITVPIRNMCDIVSEMGQLHFERKLEEKGSDEISMLSHGINVMSEELEESVNALQQDISNRRQLVRDISHELKTPIAVMKGYADGLLYGVAEDEASREKYCRVIASECERMDELIKEMLELSKLEQVTFLMESEQIELYPFLQALLEKYEKALEDKKSRQLLSCENTLCVVADKKLLEKAVGNLIGNAVHYVEEGGTVSVDAEESGENISIAVFNSGSHIDEGDIEKIWNVFYKADHARSRNNAGNGIGLSIVKTAAEHMNGAASVENMANGVKFTLQIPKTSL